MNKFQDLWDHPLDTIRWSENAPEGMGWTEHKFGIIDVFVQAAHKIFATTQHRPERMDIFVGLGHPLSIIECLPGFSLYEEDLATPNIVGMLNGWLRIVKDPYKILPVNFMLLVAEGKSVRIEVLPFRETSS